MIPCPIQTCQIPLLPANILHLLKPHNLAIPLEKLLLKHYCIHQKDIKCCPKCDFAGIMNKNCSEYQCEKCLWKWHDFNNNFSQNSNDKGFFNKLEFIISLINYKRQEFMSNIIKLFLGNYCPNCAVRVDKDGGCSHVVCARCKYEFCWYCLDGYYSYQHQSNRPCGLRFFYLMFIFGIIGYLMLCKIVAVFPTIKPLIPYFSYFFNYVPLAIAELIGIFGIPACYIIAISEFKRKGWNNSGIFWIIFIAFFIGIHSIYGYYNYLLYLYGAITNVWKLIFTIGGSYFSILIGMYLLESAQLLLKSHKYDQSLCVFIIFLCEITGISAIYIDFPYIKILMFLLECELVIALFCLINLELNFVNQKKWFARNFIEKYTKELIGAILVVFLGFNWILIYLEEFLLFKFMLVFALIASGIYFETSYANSQFKGFGMLVSGLVCIYFYLN